MKTFYPWTEQIKLPQEEVYEAYAPSDQEVVLLANTAGGYMELAIYLSAMCSLRRGEICGLKKEDLFEKHINVRKAVGIKRRTSKDEPKWKEKTTKNTSSTRIVECPPFLIEKLHEYSKDMEADERLIKVAPDQITHNFKDLIKVTGLPHFRFHDLRHYYVSSNHAIGIPDEYIMKQGGWKTDKVMKKRYRNLIADKENEFSRLAANHFEKMQAQIQTGMKD